MLTGLYHTEEQLADGLKRNERAAFESFYDHYAPGIFGMICRIVRDKKIAELVMQEAFLEFWKNIKLYDSGQGSVFYQALKIARDKANQKRSTMP